MTGKSLLHLPHYAVRIVALLVAAASFVTAIVIWQAFVNSERGQFIDEIAFKGAAGLKEKLWWLAGPILDVVSTVFIAGAILIVAAIAFARRRWRLALQATALIAGANLTTQFLKKVVLDRPDYGVAWAPGNSLPSGHTTAAASVSLALLLVVPRKWRPWVAAIGAIYTTATGVSTFVGHWHRMSDVLAAIFVTGAWTLGVCAFSERSDESGSQRPFASGTLIISSLFVVGTVLTGLATIYYLGDAFTYWETTGLTDTTIQRNAFLGSSYAVTAASLAVFGFSLILRQAVARMR